MANIQTLSVSVVARTAGFTRGLDHAQKRLSTFSDAARSSMGRLAGGFAALGAGSLGFSAVVDSLRETARLRAALTTVTGSTEAAGEAFQSLQGFAAKTPFSINEVAEAFIRLKALGLDPGMGAITSYGNTASAFGKSLSQIVEAVADATTGQFERLKEFGIRASQQGDQVAFTFRGVTTVVQKNAADIENFIRRIGDTDFSTAMSARAASLDGSLSNLGDSFNKLITAAGDAGLTKAISDLAVRMSAWAETGGSAIGSINSGLNDTLAVLGGIGDVMRTVIGAFQFLESLGHQLISNVTKPFSESISDAAGTAAHLAETKARINFKKAFGEEAFGAKPKEVLRGYFNLAETRAAQLQAKLGGGKLLGDDAALTKLAKAALKDGGRATDIGQGLQIDLARTALGANFGAPKVQRVESDQLAQILEVLRQRLNPAQGGAVAA